jgi:hypothetical protein
MQDSALHLFVHYVHCHKYSHEQMKHTLSKFSNQYLTESRSSKFAEKHSEFYHYYKFIFLILISIYISYIFYIYIYNALVVSQSHPDNVSE